MALSCVAAANNLQLRSFSQVALLMDLSADHLATAVIVSKSATLSTCKAELCPVLLHLVSDCQPHFRACGLLSSAHCCCACCSACSAMLVLTQA